MESTLRRLLAAVGDPLVDVLTAPAGLDVPVTGLAIVDPDDEADEHPGSLVLIIGARGRDAVRALRRAAAGGASAVAVKDADPLLDEASDGRRSPCSPCGPTARWERLESLARDALDEGDATRRRRPGRPVRAGPDHRRCSPAASSASRTPPAGCSPTPGPTATTRRSTSCAGSPSWAGRGRPTTCGCCASGACSTGCAPARTSSPSTSTPSSASAAGSRSASTPGSANWARSGCRRARFRSPSGRRTCWWVPPAWPPGTWSGAAASGRPGARWSREARRRPARRPHQPRPRRRHVRARRARARRWSSRSRCGSGDRAVTHELSVAELTDVVSVHAATYRRAALTAAAGRPGLRGAAERAAGPGRARAGRDVHRGGRHDAAPHRRAGAGRDRRRPRRGWPGWPASRAEADRVLDAMGAGDDVAVFGDLRAEVLLNQTLGLLRGEPRPARSGGGAARRLRPGARRATSSARCWPGWTRWATCGPRRSGSPCIPTRCATGCAAPPPIGGLAPRRPPRPSDAPPAAARRCPLRS